MPSIYQLKSHFQGLLRPVVNRLAQSGITANQVTIAAMFLSVAMGAMMGWFHEMHWPWLLLPLALFIRIALNAIDGMLARDHGMKSKLGAILNELGDVISDVALYLPFILLHEKAWIVVLVCLLAVISEMAGVIAVQIGASRRYDGPMGKSDRAFVFGTIGFLIGVGLNPGAWLGLVFSIVAVLLIVTIINRVRMALREMQEHG